MNLFSLASGTNVVSHFCLHQIGALGAVLPCSQKSLVSILDDQNSSRVILGNETGGDEDRHVEMLADRIRMLKISGITAGDNACAEKSKMNRMSGIDHDTNQRTSVPSSRRLDCFPNHLRGLCRKSNVLLFYDLPTPWPVWWRRIFGRIIQNLNSCILGDHWSFIRAGSCETDYYRKRDNTPDGKSFFADRHSARHCIRVALDGQEAPLCHGMA